MSAGVQAEVKLAEQRAPSLEGAHRVQLAEAGEQRRAPQIFDKQKNIMTGLP